MSWRTIELERRYADPAHEPEWTAADRPAWTLHNEVRKREFAAWLNRQIDELECRVRAERERSLEAVGPGIAAGVARSLATALPHLQRKLAWAREMKPNARVNHIVDRERLAEIRDGAEAKAGRPASGVHWDAPSALAARDIWRLRHVILPRLWPEGAKAGMGLTNDVLATVAADRHPDVTADAALHWYEKQRLAKL